MLLLFAMLILMLMLVFAFIFVFVFASEFVGDAYSYAKIVQVQVVFFPSNRWQTNFY